MRWHRLPAWKSVVIPAPSGRGNNPSPGEPPVGTLRANKHLLTPQRHCLFRTEDDLDESHVDGLGTKRVKTLQQRAITLEYYCTRQRR